MHYTVSYSETFFKAFRRFKGKYPSFLKEISDFIEAIEESYPKGGVGIGSSGCYKFRLAIKSKGKGKSGGARVITKAVGSHIYLLTIYDKSEKSIITKEELATVIDSCGL